MKQHRIVVSGFDKSANSEMAKLLSQNSPALVTENNEFQRAIEEIDEINGKYHWLSLFVDAEEMYNQSLLILWFGNNKRKKLEATDINNQRLINYCNELLFQPYSNSKLNEQKTRIYFVNIAQKVRFSDLASTIRQELDRGTVPFFVTDTSSFLWSWPFEILELKKNN